jgi:hypothetical protein
LFLVAGFGQRDFENDVKSLPLKRDTKADGIFSYFQENIYGILDGANEVSLDSEEDPGE